MPNAGATASAGDGAPASAASLDAPAAGSVAEEGIPAPAPAATSAATPSSGTPSVRKIDGAPVEPIDLIGTAGGTMLKRLAPVVIGLIVVLLLLRRRRS